MYVVVDDCDADDDDDDVLVIVLSLLLVFVLECCYFRGGRYRFLETIRE